MNIQLNIDDLIAEFNLPQNTANDIMKQCLDTVTGSIYEEWKKSASDNLKSTRTDYIEGLDIEVNSEFSRRIVLRGALNNMIERGADPFDMKQHFKNSPKVKFSQKVDKDGNSLTRWYLTIPMRIGVPTTIGQSSAFSSIMPTEVHKVAKTLNPGQSLKKLQIPAGFDIPKSRSAINIPSKNINFPEYQHKSSIFEDMRKNVGAYGKTTQNTYSTFRRVGENSDPDSWIHSGIKQYDLLGKALKNTDVSMIVENKVDEILANLGYGS